MTHEQMFNLIDQKPFRPYTLKTAGGREHKVAHPECVAYGGMRTIAIVVGDYWNIIDIDLIESIEE